MKKKYARPRLEFLEGRICPLVSHVAATWTGAAGLAGTVQEAFDRGGNWLGGTAPHTATSEEIVGVVMSAAAVNNLTIPGGYTFDYVYDLGASAKAWKLDGGLTLVGEGEYKSFLGVGVRFDLNGQTLTMRGNLRMAGCEIKSDVATAGTVYVGSSTGADAGKIDVYATSAVSGQFTNTVVVVGKVSSGTSSLNTAKLELDDSCTNSSLILKNSTITVAGVKGELWLSKSTGATTESGILRATGADISAIDVSGKMYVSYTTDSSYQLCNVPVTVEPVGSLFVKGWFAQDTSGSAASTISVDNLGTVVVDNSYGGATPLRWNGYRLVQEAGGVPYFGTKSDVRLIFDGGITTYGGVIDVGYAGAYPNSVMAVDYGLTMTGGTLQLYADLQAGTWKKTTVTVGGTLTCGANSGIVLTFFDNPDQNTNWTVVTATTWSGDFNTRAAYGLTETYAEAYGVYFVYGNPGGGGGGG